MANDFPRWTNWIPLKLVIALGVIGAGITVACWAYLTPEYARKGYQPSQPVPYDHQLHVEQHGMDCRYCHSFVEESGHANVPSASTCMNCHRAVKKDSPKLAPIRDAWEKGIPVEWVRVHRTPDYVYFNHSAHVNRGVSCKSCHGRVDQMEKVYHAESHSMGWCLDCHRNPEKNLRPVDEVTNLDWKPEDENPQEFRDYIAAKTGETKQEVQNRWAEKYSFEDMTKPLNQKVIGNELKMAWNVEPPTMCAGCHR